MNTMALTKNSLNFFHFQQNETIRQKELEDVHDMQSESIFTVVLYTHTCSVITLE